MMTTSLTLPPVLSLITCSLPRVITNCQDCMLRRLPSTAPQGQPNQGLWLLESVSFQLYPIKTIYSIIFTNCNAKGLLFYNIISFVGLE